MYLTQSLHRNLQQNPDRPATIYRDRTRTMAESVDRTPGWACNGATVSASSH
jgi:hypothetical protein